MALDDSGTIERMLGDMCECHKECRKEKAKQDIVNGIVEPEVQQRNVSTEHPDLKMSAK